MKVESEENDPRIESKFFLMKHLRDLMHEGIVATKMIRHIFKFNFPLPFSRPF